MAVVRLENRVETATAAADCPLPLVEPERGAARFRVQERSRRDQQDEDRDPGEPWPRRRDFPAAAFRPATVSHDWAGTTRCRRRGRPHEGFRLDTATSRRYLGRRAAVSVPTAVGASGSPDEDHPPAGRHRAAQTLATRSRECTTA